MKRVASMLITSAALLGLAGLAAGASGPGYGPDDPSRVTNMKSDNGGTTTHHKTKHHNKKHSTSGTATGGSMRHNDTEGYSRNSTGTTGAGTGSGTGGVGSNAVGTGTGGAAGGGH